MTYKSIRGRARRGGDDGAFVGRLDARIWEFVRNATSGKEFALISEYELKRLLALARAAVRKGVE